MSIFYTFKISSHSHTQPWKYVVHSECYYAIFPVPHSNEWIIYFDQIDYNCRGESAANKHPDQACWISHGINSKYGPDNSPKTHTHGCFWCYLWILIRPIIMWYSHWKLDLQSLLGDFLSPGFWWQIISRLHKSTQKSHQWYRQQVQTARIYAVIFALFFRMWALTCTLSLFCVCVLRHA